MTRSIGSLDEDTLFFRSFWQNATFKVFLPCPSQSIKLLSVKQSIVLLPCHTGLFVCNNFRLSERTYSLWGYMWQNVNDFANPLYNETKHRVLKPKTSPQFIRYGNVVNMSTSCTERQISYNLLSLGTIESNGRWKSERVFCLSTKLHQACIGLQFRGPLN